MNRGNENQRWDLRIILLSEKSIISHSNIMSQLSASLANALAKISYYRPKGAANYLIGELSIVQSVCIEEFISALAALSKNLSYVRLH